MNITIEHGMVALAVGLIGSALINAWRAGSMTATFTEAIKELRKQYDRLDERAEALDRIPGIERKLEDLDGAVSDLSGTVNRSIRPEMARQGAEIKAVAERVSSIRAMRTPFRSRPDE